MCKETIVCGVPGIDGNQEKGPPYFTIPPEDSAPPNES